MYRVQLEIRLMMSRNLASDVESSRVYPESWNMLVEISEQFEQVWHFVASCVFCHRTPIQAWKQFLLFCIGKLLSDGTKIMQRKQSTNDESHSFSPNHITFTDVWLLVLLFYPCGAISNGDCQWWECQSWHDCYSYSWRNFSAATQWCINSYTAVIVLSAVQ